MISYQEKFMNYWRKEINLGRENDLRTEESDLRTGKSDLMTGKSDLMTGKSDLMSKANDLRTEGQGNVAWRIKLTTGEEGANMIDGAGSKIGTRKEIEAITGNVTGILLDFVILILETGEDLVLAHGNVPETMIGIGAMIDTESSFHAFQMWMRVKERGFMLQELEELVFVYENCFETKLSAANQKDGASNILYQSFFSSFGEFGQASAAIGTIYYPP